MPIVFEHITRSPEERAFRARIAARERALLAEAAAVRAARQAAAGGERRRVIVAPHGDGAGHGRTPASGARVVAPLPAAPSLFRALRPGDRIVTPPSLTTALPTSTTPTPRTIPHEHEPEIVAAVLARRAVAVDRMARWNRGDPGARPSAAAPVASAPAAHATHPAAPLPVAEIFASRQRTIAASRPWAARKES